MKNVVFVSLLVTTLLPFKVQAGPFGFDMGKQASEYGCASMSTANMYKCSEAPKEHPAFESYILQSTPKHGVCWIKAVGKNISDNGYGMSTKSVVDGFVEAFKNSYGENVKKSDFLLSSSIWNEGDEFLMGLVKNERSYNYHWKTTTNSSIKEIYVAAKGLRSDVGYPVVEYYGTHYDACDSYTDQTVNDVF